MEIINYEPGDYYYTFSEHMENYLKIKSAKALFLINELCSRAEWNTGRVLLPAGIKKEICTKIKFDYSNISKLLRMLRLYYKKIRRSLLYKSKSFLERRIGRKGKTY